MRSVRRCAASLSRCVVLVFCCRLTQSQPKRYAWVWLPQPLTEEDLEVATAKVNIAFEKHNQTLEKYGEGSLQAQQSALGLSQAESRLNAEVEGTNDKLTAQQKTLATQSLIMNATKDAQGDFGRTSDGLANSQRILTAQMKDLQANMGKILLPIVESAVAFFSDFTGVLAGNQKVMVVVIGVVAALATAIIAANVAMKIYTATTKAAAAAQQLFNFIMKTKPNRVSNYRSRSVCCSANRARKTVWHYQ
jgi:hypothetical protein